MEQNDVSLYSGFFAEFYDILHAGLSDVDSYVKFGQTYGPDILELGSGTGRILVPLAKAGCNVTGVDLSDDMIARCLAKINLENEVLKSRVAIVNQDISQLDLGKKFDLIIAPCNMINHFCEPPKLKQALGCVKNHLKPKGVFILDNSIPDIPYMVYINRVERIFTFEHPLTGTKIVNRLTSTYDFIHQLEHNSVYLKEYDNKGNMLRKANCSATMAYFFPRELKLILEFSGLEVFHEQGTLLENSPIGPDSTEMVFFCRLPR